MITKLAPWLVWHSSGCGWWEDLPWLWVLFTLIYSLDRIQGLERGLLPLLAASLYFHTVLFTSLHELFVLCNAPLPYCAISEWANYELKPAYIVYTVYIFFAFNLWCQIFFPAMKKVSKTCIFEYWEYFLKEKITELLTDYDRKTLDPIRNYFMCILAHSFTFTNYLKLAIVTWYIQTLTQSLNVHSFTYSVT